MTFSFSRNNRQKRWTISDEKLIFHHPNIEIFWEVPDDFSMPSSPILGLAEYVLLTPFNESVELEQPQRKKPIIEYDDDYVPKVDGRTKIGVAFSGGIDSTAVLHLLPNCVPIYTQVHNPRGKHKIENALLSVDEVRGFAIISNCDELPETYGRSRGFYGSAGFTTTGILFSEYFGLYALADGNVLERMYLYGPQGHGTKYRDLDLTKTIDAFEGVNLSYCVPCAGMTEVLTTKIADKIGMKYSMGCMRGSGGKPCNNCLKCFRKRGLNGNPLPTNKEVDKKLNGDYIPMLPSLLWARDNNGLSHPIFDNIVMDIYWVDKWYQKSLEYIPHYLHKFFLYKLDEFEIEVLEDPHGLLSFSSKIV